VTNNSKFYGVHETFLREVSSLVALRGQPSIVELRHIECNISQGIIYEKKYLTDLHKYIHQCGTIDPAEIKRIIYELLKIISISHQHNILNGDLKPSNVLLDDGHHIAVCDWGFGLSVSQFRKEISLPMVLQTISYRAPEVLCHFCPYTQKLDVWSLGIILCEMINGQRLFINPLSETEDNRQQLNSIFELFGHPTFSMWENLYRLTRYSRNTDTGACRSIRSINNAIKTTDELCLDLIDQLTQYDPNKRCSCDQALQHPYFNQIERPVTNDQSLTDDQSPYMAHINPMKYANEMGFTADDRETVLRRVSKALTDYSMHKSVYFSGLVYFDEYITANKVSVSDLLVSCFCCMLIAEKINGYSQFSIEDIASELRVYYKLYKCIEIRQIEVHIIKALNYTFFRPNLYHLLIYQVEKQQLTHDRKLMIIDKYYQATYDPNFYGIDQNLLIMNIISNVNII
jgi:serine/threonine protein kinase